jgi:hypothetical protein
MAHTPTQEDDVQKVYRIARELGISLEEAAVTCAGFELAFSEDGLRRSIFGMIGELDGSAAKKGEPLGLIISYAVELGMDGIWVGRYADEIPPGSIVELTPTNRARILLRIKDNFPTQEVLGPMIVNRPEKEFERESCDTEISSDVSTIEPTDAVLVEQIRTVICLGPIRHIFSERFPFLSAVASPSQDSRGRFGLSSSARTSSAGPLLGLVESAAVATHSVQATSGLSPPPALGECRHSERKLSWGSWQ